MVFVPGSIANKQINTDVSNDTGYTDKFIPGSVANAVTKKTASHDEFVTGSIAGNFKSVSSNKFDTSDSLYNLAVQSGFQKEADGILKEQSGENTKLIFSGGFISDIFDVLNAFQYGVVGLLKGKSFLEGVETRQSFTDKDALGDKGIPGLIAGVALDIAFDPLTYIAPATVINKVPFATKIAKGVEELVFGKLVTKAIEGTDSTYQALEGGTKLGKYLASKLSWMSGADPNFRESFERSTKNIAVETQNLVEMARAVSKISPETATKILSRDETGRFIRIPIEGLTGSLNQQELQAVTDFYKKLDDLGRQAVDLGLLGKSKYEEHLGEYIKNAYTEYEQAQSKGLFGYAKAGIKGIKSRVEGLTPEMMKELGQIDNPAYLLFKSTFDLTKDVENAKLFKTISEKFGTEIAQEGFMQIPKSTRFIASSGKQAEILTDVKKINNDLKPLFASLKSTFKADRKTLEEITRIEKQFGYLSELQGEELYKFFQEGETVSKISPIKRLIRGVGKLPAHLNDIGNDVKKFSSVAEVLSSPVGVKLEKLYEDGVLQRNGFKSMEDFFDFVTQPYKLVGGTEKEVTAVSHMPKIIKLQSDIEKLLQKSSILKEIDKRSINDSFRVLEKSINELKFTKEDLLQELASAKLGDLAGKYVPKNIYDYLQEIIKPSEKTIGKQLIANFKFFKVIMNPATHARNIISNKLLNWWKLGMNPLDPRVIVSDLEAGGEIVKGGGKWTELAKPHGYNVDTFASAEMKDLLNSPEVSAWGRGVKGWQKIKQALGNIYQSEENHAKLSAFIFNSKKGMAPEEAWKAAESATFNYAQVTPFVRKLRESLFGYPFITFTVKATPIAIETAIKAPHRISVIGKIKQGIENLSDVKETDREKASEPPWIKDNFFIKLPMKDKEGRSAYFDLTYILPFGDLIAGNFFERQTLRETGLPESYTTAILKKSPFINLVIEIGKNQDFYGNKIWKNSDPSEKQLGDLMRHLVKAMAPPLVGDQLPGGYNEKGIQQQRGIIGAVTPQEKANQQRTLMEELLRQVGAKVQPIDADIQETYQEFNKKKSLQSLLLENGVLSNFNRTYIPK